jgi:hypothetical protein
LISIDVQNDFVSAISGLCWSQMRFLSSIPREKKI